MINNKQSSVDFYRIECQKLMIKAIRKEITEKEWRLLENKLGEQAKEMHKEEITTSMEIAFVDGCRFDNEDYISPFEDWNHYYNETFGENKPEE